MLLIRPVLRLEENIVQFGFRGAGLWRVGILPAHHRWQRHQNRFGTAIGLQTKQSASIKDQIKLDVAAPAVELKVALALTVWFVCVLFDNGNVRGKKGVASVAGELKD